MSEQVQVAPVATNTPFDYSQNLVISVGVSDLERAIEWYKDVLGLELVYKLDQYGWCEMSTATKHVTIGLGQTEELKPGRRRRPAACSTSTRPGSTSSRRTCASTATRTRSRAWSSSRRSTTPTATRTCSRRASPTRFLPRLTA